MYNKEIIRIVMGIYKKSHKTLLNLPADFVYNRMKGVFEPWQERK